MTRDPSKNPIGCPPKYKAPEEMQILIDKYFIDCEGKPYINADGEIIYDKSGMPFIKDKRVPTVTGLALALDFTSRQAILNYQGKKDFVDTITRAKLKIEEATSQMLYARDGAKGAIFMLGNNYGYSDKLALENADGNAFKVVVEYVSADGKDK